MECSNCHRDLENNEDALTGDNDRYYCDDQCYRSYIAGLEAYIQKYGE